MESMRGRDSGARPSSSWGTRLSPRRCRRMGRNLQIVTHRWSITLTISALAACGGTVKNGGDDDGDGDTPVLLRASRSSTIALTGDRALVAMVNPDDDSLSLFQTSDD